MIRTNMKFKKLIAVSLLLLPFLTGCMGKQVHRDNIHDQVNVYGIRLFSDADYREINGARAVEEPCLRGYERAFDALDLTVGYGFDKKIRKITTRNSGTSMFDIKPGMSLQEGTQKILQAGFVEFAAPFKFRSNGYSVTFLVDDKDMIFGLTLESLD